LLVSRILSVFRIGRSNRKLHAYPVVSGRHLVVRFFCRMQPEVEDERDKEKKMGTRWDEWMDEC